MRYLHERDQKTQKESNIKEGFSLKNGENILHNNNFLFWDRRGCGIEYERSITGR